MLPETDSVITANANDIARITLIRTLLRFFPQTLCHASFKHSIFASDPTAGFRPLSALLLIISLIVNQKPYEQLSACLTIT